MEYIPIYKVLRATSSHFRVWILGSRWSSSVAATTTENSTVAGSVREDFALSVRKPVNGDVQNQKSSLAKSVRTDFALSPTDHNGPIVNGEVRNKPSPFGRITRTDFALSLSGPNRRPRKREVPVQNQRGLAKTSTPLLNVEKNLVPLFLLEEEMMRLLSNSGKMSAKKGTSQVQVFPGRKISKPKYTRSLTALEFNEMKKLAQMSVKVEKPVPKALSSGQYVTRSTTVNGKEIKKGALLPFVTKLPTFRQPNVRQQAGFASITEKTIERFTKEMKTSPVVMKDTSTEVVNERVAPPPIEGSPEDGSFTKITHVNLFQDADPHSFALSSKMKRLIVATPPPPSQPPAPPRSPPPPPSINRQQDDEEEEEETVVTVRVVTPKSPIHDFLKYQTVAPPTPTPITPSTDQEPAADVGKRTEAELKACSVVTQQGTLRDAKTLIEANKSRFAPRTLMNLKECVEYQYNDHKTLALLRKYRTLKMREIDYHHAQIKKHRKQLLELMFKTPYQKTPDPSKIR